MKYWIWLTKIKINPYTKYKLLMKYILPEIIYYLTKEDLQKECIDKDKIKEILDDTYKQNLDLEEKYLKRNNIKLITIYDEEYPENLRNIYDPPIAIYLYGNDKIFSTYAVGMVGCRNCSIYGEMQAKEISYKLAKNNIVVVSGLAKGIDKHSHVGCMAGHGKTVAVLGCGINIIYPKENIEVARKIIETSGAIISEYPIGSKPEKDNFPQRNRIISGISDAVIVVEAKIKSGSIITADFAMEQGKDVYAVPGNVTSKNSEGTNDLIKQGAIPLTNIQDITL